jgi:hypothetical protein
MEECTPSVRVTLGEEDMYLQTRLITFDILLRFSGRNYENMFIFWWQHLCWLALFTRVSATSVNLLNVLQNTAELSTLYSYVNASSNLTHLLSNADDFTFLAASNDAIATFVKHNPNTLTQDVLLATLQYSLLQGVFPSLSFSNTSQFVSSNLISGTFTNVTGGQVVELGLGNSGDPQVISGNKTISPSISAVCQIMYHNYDCFDILRSSSGYCLHRWPSSCDRHARSNTRPSCIGDLGNPA